MKTNYEKLMKINYEKLLIFYLPFTPSHRAVPRGDDMAPSACLNQIPGGHGSTGL
jgi:hypothetical protein